MSYYKRMNPRSVGAKHTNSLSARDSEDHMSAIVDVEKNLLTQILMHKLFIHTFLEEPPRGPSALVILR